MCPAACNLQLPPRTRIRASGRRMGTGTKAAPSDRRDTRTFFVLMASTFTVSLGYGAVLPLLPYFLVRLLPQASSAAVSWHTGMLAGAYMFAVFLFAPLWGLLSDRIGRRPVILLGLGGYALTLVLLGFSRSLWFAYLMRALGGSLRGRGRACRFGFHQ